MSGSSIMPMHTIKMKKTTGKWFQAEAGDDPKVLVDPAQEQLLQDDKDPSPMRGLSAKAKTSPKVQVKVEQARVPGSKALHKRMTPEPRLQEGQRVLRTPCMPSPLGLAKWAQVAGLATSACPPWTDLGPGMLNLQVAFQASTTLVHGANACSVTGSCGTAKCGLSQKVQEWRVLCFSGCAQVLALVCQIPQGFRNS